MSADRQLQTVLCLKWGDRYGPRYVNRLYGMVARNTRRPLRMVCITDDPTGLRPEVEVRPMPPFDLPEEFRYRGFRRLFIFEETLYDLQGVVLHLDLDLVVTGSIDDFFDEQPDRDYIVSENWTQPGEGIGNMSVFRFRVGSMPHIWDRFRADPMGMFRQYRNSQTFFSRTYGEVPFFPSPWCIGFKHSLIPRWPMNFFQVPAGPPDEARIVAFTGKPDMDEAIEGRWPVSGWWKRLYKHVRPTPWVAEVWRD